MSTRRMFLRSMAALGAAASAARARIARAGAADALTGKVYFRGSARYEPLRQAAAFNARKPNRFPEAIVMPTEEADVVAAVKLARERGWQVATRSGGHSWSSSHTRNNSVQINLARMQQMDIDPAAGIARITPSIYGNQLNKLLREQYGLFVPSAHGWNVGMGGFMMCGGHGWNSRQMGLGCENLLGVDLVTADGELIHADERQNSDYWWAARGAGPGFFGTALRYHIKLHQRPTVFKTSGFRFTMDHFEEITTWMIERIPLFPPEMEMVITVMKRDGALAVTLIGSCFGNDAATAEKTLQVMDSVPNQDKALLKWKNRDRVVPYDEEPAGDVQPTGARFSVDNIWTNSPAAPMLPYLRRSIENFPSDSSSLFMQVWGPLRKLPDMAYSVQADTYIAYNGTYYEPADDQKVEDWAKQSAHSMRRFEVGAQMNDENMAVRRSRYLAPPAQRRLAAMHRKHDPERVFPGFMLKA